MTNRLRIKEIFNRYLDASVYLDLYEKNDSKQKYILHENTLNAQEYEQKLSFLRGLQYRREIVERVESSLESLMSEDEKILRLCYIKELTRNEVMEVLSYKERTYYRKLAKAESLFIQVHDYSRGCND